MSKTNSVRTPRYILQWVRKKFGKIYDPVPFNPNFGKGDKDALTTEWKKVNYVNPPFAQTVQFLKKSVEQWKKGRTVIFLCKLDTLGRQAFVPGCEIVLFKKPVIFPGYDNVPRFSVCLLLYRAGKKSSKYSFFTN